jgi:SH3-like domain-containing protein
MVKTSLNKIVLSALLNFVVLFLMAAPVTAYVTKEGQKVGPSGSILPRFVSLSADEANMRTGPGRQYPIEWIYARRDLPLEVIDEFGPWRQVRDNAGTVGWMHVILLDNKRTAMVIDEKLRLFEETSKASEVTIIADRGVIGSIEYCRDAWCKINIDGTSGWTERKYLWGVYPTEIIE